MKSSNSNTDAKLTISSSHARCWKKNNTKDELDWKKG